MQTETPLNRRLSVAPMMDWTDRHARYFLRLCAPNALLYTEMVTAAAVTHGDRAYLLGFDAFEQPLALQLGGSDPVQLAQAAALGERYGYREINLNVGCPSDRVQAGRFGACLLKEPVLVAQCVAAMSRACGLPVTVKTRIGVDEQDSYEALCAFVETVAAAGCRSFTLHARKAWLQGLSPKENREIPPLDYPRVYRLKADYPQLEIIINGGISRLDAVREHLARVDGVMIGREAYHNPYALAEWDAALFGDGSPARSRHEVLAAYLPYVQARLEDGLRLQAMARHVLGLFQGRPGAKAWRRYISENAHRAGAGVEVLEEAARRVPEDSAATAEA
ncbi:tRNA dihydrouridine(20/20a) synthase DusA [Alkalilimnicola sp. S0819]|uniref:tRNA dihydrouridine(20/20a) synthase DusA n=1 Tax=Alkalilimnicola sp. S0819 TaxID=2613922 RepID=UPI001262A9B0|nr:tRNA dihydrouridine(20/20a) synthase DusA [Alkalilimnicola sp. S0819]KAB7619499.1 tRNA dihydrouridine(20/20a) synthase DusA [Alkalilimnicola sp. S0819]MPQ17677.1 tRNA dihydrouridine(20/20a) synthase DusA [Alkalilimnicola sp. S0819]